MRWCLGMYASGSTWLYNAMRLVAEAVAPGRPVRASYVASAAELPGLADPAVLHVVKSHDVDAAVAAALEQAAERILMTLRDPRDAVASLMRHMDHDFDTALALIERSARFCAARAGDARTVVLRYEDGFIDDPATLDRLAAGLGGPLAQADRARIFAATRRGAIEALIARLDTLPGTLHDVRSGDMVDPVTQWHRHHAGRTGEVGGWRWVLGAARAGIVERRLEDWMAAWGYAADPPIRAGGYRLRIGYRVDLR